MALDILGNLQGIGELAVSLRTAITGEAPLDPNKRAELATKTLEIEQAATLAQIAVNQAEAASTSVFKGGWRPAIGWVCAAALAWQFLLTPLLPWIGGMVTSRSIPPIPIIDTGMLFNLMFGMLGLGGLRTLEKIKGVS